MKIVLWSISVTLLMLLFVTHPATAEEPSCIDQARTREDLIRCGSKTTELLEGQIASEFKRLAKRFEAYKHMQEYLQQLKDAWYRYHNYQCIFEAAAVPLVDGSTKQVLPPEKVPMIKGLEKPSIELDKAYHRCVHRTAQEMYAALVKL